jgi:hypothetical protein
MKTAAVFLCSCVLIMLAIFSCSKEGSGNSPQPTRKDTVYIRDTIRIHDTVVSPQPSRLQILTEKTWQIDEMVRSDGGIITEYNRGGLNTTGVSFQNMKFKFNTDFTGTYIDQVGVSHTLTWNYIGSDQTKFSLTIGPPSANTFSWRIVELKNNLLHSTSVYGNILISHRWIQVP